MKLLGGFEGILCYFDIITVGYCAHAPTLLLKERHFILLYHYILNGIVSYLAFRCLQLIILYHIVLCRAPLSITAIFLKTF